MAHYPPPPQPDQQHYNALYPGATNTQQLLDSVQQDQLQYSTLTQPLFPKPDSAGGDQSQNSRSIHRIAQELQQHAAMEEQQRQQMQQATHQIHRADSQPPQTDTHLSQAQAHATALEQSQKANRLRKACDSCSIRKVKCDESGPPCRACAALDIPCTFQRPSRRRGPPNRHAEALKRRRLDDPTADLLIPDLPSPSSPTHAAQALAALSSHPANLHLSAESLCPIGILHQLIDDFFTYIHPLCPFPHEPSFREAWKRREDLNNTRFLALLASMMATLIAVFPHKLRIPVSRPRSLVNRCLQLCSVARGPGYLDGENLNVYDAATSQFMAHAALFMSRPRQSRLYYGECLTILDALGLQRFGEKKGSESGGFPLAVSADTDANIDPEPPFDNITVEIGRRIFWTALVNIRAQKQIDPAMGGLLIRPPTSAEPYLPLPSEVDDFCIYPTHNEPQPEGLLPMVNGFNATARVYHSYTILDTLEMTKDVDNNFDWKQQSRLLHQSLKQCKNWSTELSRELNVEGSGSLNSEASDLQTLLTKANASASSTVPPIGALHQGEQEQRPEQRRQMQHGIQKAMFYASFLSTRSFLVEKYWRLHQKRQQAHSTANGAPETDAAYVTGASAEKLLSGHWSPGAEVIEAEMQHEWESVVQDLFHVLRNVVLVDMEPSGTSFAIKLHTTVRRVNDIPKQRKGPLANKAQSHLSQLLQILNRLISQPIEDDDALPPTPEEEAAMLQPWNDLRDFQLKLSQPDVLAETS